MDIIPLPFSYPYGALFWTTYLWAFIISEWSVIQHSRATLNKQTKKTQDSLQWITKTILLAQLVAFALAFLPVAKFPPNLIESIFYIAISLLIIGSLFRRHCFNMLGKSFTLDVRVNDNQEVVDKGAYAYIRHPGYSSGIIMMTGVGLAFGSYLSFLIILVTTVFLYIRRIQFEERALVAVLGDKYLNYAKGRKRLIPYIY